MMVHSVFRNSRTDADRSPTPGSGDVQQFLRSPFTKDHPVGFCLGPEKVEQRGGRGWGRR